MESIAHVQQCVTQLPASADNLVKLWLYRAMVCLDARNGLIGCLGWEDYWVTQYLGLEDCIVEKDEPSMRLVTEKLGRQLAKLEQTSVRKALPRTLAANIDHLARMLRLSPTGQALIAFAVMLDNVRLLAAGTALLNKLSTTDLYHALAVILALPESAVRRELRHDGPLIRSGLVMLKRRDRCDLPEKIRTLSPEFAERMMIERGGDLSVFGDMFFRSHLPTLNRRDFSHVDRQYAILLSLLRTSSKQKAVGINVLVHGEPGVGKTEFARLLAQDAGFVLHEVASAGRDGEPFDGESRLNAYQAAACVLARGRNFLMFDEAEDVFGQGGGMFAPTSVAQARKAWMNRALEENRVPTIWLTNAIDGIDPAFVRRFSMVIEMPTPSRARMRHLVKEVAGDLMTSGAIGRLAEVPNLAPGVVTRAAQIVRSVRQDIGAE